ncbi:MAG: CinA family protein [Pseudomonadota bacterium]
MIATAESCTGGLIAAALTDIAGSSSVFERGFVTYSNDAKTTLLGVPAATIDAHGAVSRPVALAMARGAVAASRAALAVSVTGVAGPGGGTPEKPVGLVWFGVHGPAGAAIAERRVFPAAGRAFIRERATQTALRLLLFHL